MTSPVAAFDPAAAPSSVTYGKAGLILLTLALFATAHLVHYAMALLALGGVIECVCRPQLARSGRGPTLLVLFLLIWVPMLAAVPGAVARGHTINTVFAYLHYLPAAYFVMRACSEPEVRHLVTRGAALLVTFVAIDAFIQLIWHRDLFGYPYEAGILKGVFYPKQRLGLLLAVLCALEIEVVREWCRRYPRLWLLLIPLVIVILMSLKRAAWLMLALSLLGYLALRLRRGLRLRRKWLLQAALIVLLATGATAMNPVMKARLVETSGMFSTNAKALDVATAYRWSLWQTGSAMVRAHWLLGIGPRGFRHAYRDFAPPDDFWMRLNGRGQTHPHLFLLEVLIETGGVGLIGLVLFYGLLVRLLLRPSVGRMVPVWLLSAAVASFPLNAHMAFYSAYWSTLVWLLIGAGLAEVQAGDDASEPSPTPLSGPGVG